MELRHVRQSSSTREHRRRTGLLARAAAAPTDLQTESVAAPDPSICDKFPQ